MSIVFGSPTHTTTFVFSLVFVLGVRLGLEMDGAAGGEGGDVDAFELGGDEMGMGGGGEGMGMDVMEDCGGGYEADPNLNVAPDMQVGAGCRCQGQRAKRHVASLRGFFHQK